MNTVEIIFSPTGGTEKVAHILGGHWSENTVKIDLSDSKACLLYTSPSPRDRG